MNNFYYAFRYLLKARGSNLTRMLSLALGLCAGLIVFSYVTFTLTFNDFFPNKDRLYQMWSSSTLDGKVGTSSGVKGAIAPALGQEMPQVEASTRLISGFVNDFFVKDEAFTVKFMIADSALFDVLDFRVKQGNPKEVLQHIGGVLISESMAERMFGKIDPIGQKIKDTFGNVSTVEGVFEDTPANSSLGEFDLIFPFVQIVNSYNPSWNGSPSFQTFIKVKQGASIDDITAQLPSFFQRHQQVEEIKQMKASYFFVPLTKTATEGNNVIQVALLLGMLGLLTIFVACMNYVLISISTLVNRGKTIGMLQCNGASKRDIFAIFIYETALIVAGALLVAILLIVALGHQIEAISGYSISALFAIGKIWVPLLVVVSTFLIAGLLPARLFSSIPLTHAFRGVSNNRRGWKKVLLFAQLGSITFVVSYLAIMFLQFQKLSKGDFGYKHDKLVYVSMMSNFNNLLSAEDRLRSLSVVESVGTAFKMPLWTPTDALCYDENSKEPLFNCTEDYATAGYIPTMQISIVEGRNFSPSGQSNEVIVNEKYVEMRQWKDSPIGHQIAMAKEADAKLYTIVGVVQNFKMDAAVGLYKPYVLHNMREKMINDQGFYGGQRTVIRLKELNAASIDSIKAFTKGIMTIDNGKVVVYDDMLSMVLTSTRNLRNLVFLIALITILIVLLGLIGYLTDEVRRLGKEIAIRKVNGAQVGDVLWLLAKDLAVITIPAIALGLAVGYYIGSLSLQKFETKISLSWWIFFGSALILLAIVYSIQLLKTWSVANSNPVKMIKSE